MFKFEKRLKSSPEPEEASQSSDETVKPGASLRSKEDLFNEVDTILKMGFAKNVEEAKQLLEFEKGNLTDEDIKYFKQNPEKPIFSFAIKGKENNQESFSLKFMTSKFIDPLVKNMESSWDQDSNEEFRESLSKISKLEKRNTPSTMNEEYFVLLNEKQDPVGVCGIYTMDIEGGIGLSTKDKLDPKKHNTLARVDWMVVRKEDQGKKLGSKMFDWVENMARSRGFKVLAIETDNIENSQVARNLYAKRGYEVSHHVKDYYGPNRDLFTYYKDVSKDNSVKDFIPKENITLDNMFEVIAMAEKNYSKEKLEEFKVCLGLILAQNGDVSDLPLKPYSFVERSSEGKINNFAIVDEYCYRNTFYSTWKGYDIDDANAENKLFQNLSGFVKAHDRDMLILYEDQKSENLSKSNFNEPKEGEGIPGVFGRDEMKDVEFLLHSKRLD